MSATSWDPHRRLLTIDEAAKSVGRSASTIRNWVQDQRLRPHARMGRRNLYLEVDVLAAEADARGKDLRIGPLPRNRLRNRG